MTVIIIKSTISFFYEIKSLKDFTVTRQNQNIAANTSPFLFFKKICNTTGGGNMTYKNK